MADNWIEKLKMAATKHIAKKYHSPAGRKYLKRKKEIKNTHLSRQSKTHLTDLSNEDYKLVMKALKDR